MKTNEELIGLYYLNINQVRKVFNLSYPKAKKVFDIANKIDSEELKEYRIEDKKVRMKTLLKIQHMSYQELKRKGL